MLGTMLLGYAIGAIGVYGLLYRFAPVRREEGRTHSTPGETIPLFDSARAEETQRAA